MGHIVCDAAATPAKPLVLVVEDDAAIARLLGRFLARGGYATVFARDGAEALRVARDARPEAITLDIVLPDRDGREVLAELQTDARTRDIPVIVVSIHGDDIALSGLPVIAVLAKPIDQRRLRSAVADALTNRARHARQ